ncbi:RDD family protein [Sulfurospirillum sp. 1307]
MGRWRDVKHGKVEKKSASKTMPSFIISPITTRIKAFITDTFMILMPLMYFVFYVIMGSREEFAAHMLQGWIYIFVPHFFIIIAFWYFKGQTPGYKAYNIKLVDTKLKKPSLFKLIVRYIVFAASFVLIAGLLFALIRRDKKNLHDLISQTIPIEE